ncbi:uncharacterized protein LOC128559029 [Mercenaria mercenaria]|uniref:uncharacterized protein LOC128559029 n=1 Tax=Mercenaria mercenaria TaxID=6596 RepID=UPI00234E9345|nr:uncharacterized protein LOC128559029 [Mercenaria mercenaria]
MNYQETLKKLTDRFDEHDIPATVQAKFMQSSQTIGETLEDWADRVLTLTVRAFKGLPETFANEQAVNKFCQGMEDKDAGEYVCNQAPGTVHQAIQMVRRYQQIHVAMHGKSKPDRQKRRVDYDSETVSAFNQIQPSRSEYVQQQGLQKALQDLEVRLKKTIIDKLEQPGKRMRPTRPRFEHKSRACYTCGKEGHFRRNCPNKQKYNLNFKGSEKKAAPQPPSQ